MSTAPLGRLERVPLRIVWESEASDFTPWLARPANIALLGEALQLDLEVEGEEQDVGPFRADILCKDTTTDRWVVIENQLNGTDHGHLGQLLTYAAGLQATAVVWIAERFTDEHWAALDWLNRATGEEVHFFGLEIEVWKIGSSLPAPKFNVVCQPNGWADVVATTAKQAEAGALSPRNQAYLAFWQRLAEDMKGHSSAPRPQAPKGKHYYVFAVGRSNFSLIASIHDGGVWASLCCSDAELWPAVLAVKGEADAEAGFETSEDFEEGRKQNYLGVECGDIDLDAPVTWAPLITALRTTLETMYRVFAPRVRSLEPLG